MESAVNLELRMIFSGLRVASVEYSAWGRVVLSSSATNLAYSNICSYYERFSKTSQLVAMPRLTSIFSRRPNSFS